MIEKTITPKKLKVPKKLKRLVIDAAKRHAWNIGVSHFDGDVLWMAEDEKYEGNHKHAEIDVDRRYLKATFKIFPVAIKFWKSDGDEYMEHTIAHEVAHIATQHLYELAIATYRDEGEMKDAWETLTEVIGKLSVNLDKYRNPKK